MEYFFPDGKAPDRIPVPPDSDSESDMSNRTDGLEASSDSRVKHNASPLVLNSKTAGLLSQAQTQQRRSRKPAAPQWVNPHWQHPAARVQRRDTSQERKHNDQDDDQDDDDAAAAAADTDATDADAKINDEPNASSSSDEDKVDEESAKDINEQS